MQQAHKLTCNNLRSELTDLHTLKENTLVNGENVITTQPSEPKSKHALICFSVYQTQTQLANLCHIKWPS